DDDLVPDACEALLCCLLEEVAEEGKRVGVEAEFRLIKEHRGRAVRLEECGCKADEPKRAIGELVGKKGVVRILLLPFELDESGIGWYGAELEVVEEGCGETDCVANFLVGFRVGLADAIEEGCEILGIGTEYFVVVDWSLPSYAGR